MSGDDAGAVEYTVAAPAFLKALSAFVDSAAALEERDLLDPARCRGWSRLDAVVHVRMGVEEMLLGAVEVDAAADHDAISYWRGFAADQGDTHDDVDRLLYLRRTAAAYRRPAAAVAHLAAVADRAPHVLAALRPESVVAFQGQRLRVGDFLATWAVEVACHHLDLALPDGHPAPPDAALRLTVETLEALAGQPLPSALSDFSPLDAVVLTALGRTPWPARLDRPEGYPVSL